MLPVLFSIGPLNIYGYGVMIAIGIVVAFWVALNRAPKFGLNEDTLFSVGIVAAICGFAGTKILFCIVELPTFLADPIGTLFSGNGFVVYGGIIGGILGGVLWCKHKKGAPLKYFDLIMPSISLAQGFGRIGCFLAGCCYGAETDSPIGIAFSHSELAPNGVKLIPTQLFSSLGDFIIAAILLVYAKRNKKDGNVGFLYLILYSVGRFGIEFFRNDYRGAVGFLSTSQFISIICVVAGLVLMVFNAKRKPKMVMEIDSLENIACAEEEKKEEK